MKSNTTKWMHRIVPVMLIASLGWAVDASAAEEGMQFTRETYDLIMRYVNFLILAGVIVKFGRGPIVKFLTDQRDTVASTLEKFEGKKKVAQEKIAESQNLLEASNERLSLIKERIVAEGERRKAALIAEAKEQSRTMLESAKAKIEGQIREARDTVKAELVDMASDKATAKLPAMMTPEDHQRLIEQWFTASGTDRA